jgi:hypothetical protein
VDDRCAGASRVDGFEPDDYVTAAEARGLASVLVAAAGELDGTGRRIVITTEVTAILLFLIGTAVGVTIGQMVVVAPAATD